MMRAAECRTSQQCQVRTILRAATVGLVLSGTCSMANASGRQAPQSATSEPQSLRDLTRQLEESRLTYHFSWPPDCWVGDDREAVTKFLADNDQRVKELRSKLGTAHALEKNPLLRLETARTVCNVMVAAAVIARNKDESESVKCLREVLEAISLIPEAPDDEGWRSVYISTLLGILQPGVQECGGVEHLALVAPALVTLELQLQAEYYSEIAPQSDYGASTGVLIGIARCELMRVAIGAWIFERENHRLPTSFDEVPLWDPRSSSKGEIPVFEWSLVQDSIFVSWTPPKALPFQLSIALKPKAPLGSK